jgi:hypothetical protein
MAVGYFYYIKNIFWLKWDSLREEESPRNQDHYPKQTTLKLENFMFTKAWIYFSNAISKWLVPLKMG